MDIEYFRTLFAYTYWARDRLLSQVGQLSQEDYVAPRPLDYGSIRATLVHALSAEAGYLARWKGEPLETPINEETVPTFAVLQEQWVDQQAKMTAFLGGLTDVDTNREMRQVSRSDGRESVNPLWALMAQLVNHATQHRAEVAMTITQLGHSPGDMDVTRYLREKQA